MPPPPAVESLAGKPPALRRTIDRYLQANGLDIKPSHEVDNLGAVMSLIVSTRGFALLPLYARGFLPDSVVTRPLACPGPVIDLSVAYRKANPSPTLKLFLSRLEQLTQELSTPDRRTVGPQLPSSRPEHLTV